MKHLFSCFLCFQLFILQGQNCANLNFQNEHEIASTCNKMSITMLHDRLDRPFLYIANKENGVLIYDISDLQNPLAVLTIDTLLLGGQAMNLWQDENRLFVATGNTFNSTDLAGMAIIDISDPLLAQVSGSYHLAGSSGGSGIVVNSGNYAYLGAMGSGLVVLDISNPGNIQELAVLKPDINFPDNNADPAKVNARGMAIQNDRVYLCYDAGGLRIIDVSNKNLPVEIGRFANPLLNNLPRAYNNVSINGNLAYVAVDYCGLEILDISNPSNIQLIGWWNPYNCPGNNWFTSPVHANEIRLIPECGQVFLSTGKSDLIVVDVSDPTQPDSCHFYGGVSNATGTWGVDVWRNKLSLSYVCALIPFTSFYTGVKTMSFTSCALGSSSLNHPDIVLYPNPASASVEVRSSVAIEQIRIYDLTGNLVDQVSVNASNTFYMSLDQLGAGSYFLEIECGDKIYIKKIIHTP